MGIRIRIQVSDYTPADVWTQIYEESVHLLEVFPLAELRLTEYDGVEYCALVPTRPNDQVHGWVAHGDLDTMGTGETYYMPEGLPFVRPPLTEPYYQDPLYSPLWIQSLIDYEDEEHAGYTEFAEYVQYLNSYCAGSDGIDGPFYMGGVELWGEKTQGEAYHLYLLAIGCLICNRLGDMAYMDGDFTRGQCRKAIELANPHLDTPLHLPDFFDLEAHYLRICKLPLEPLEQLALLMHTFQGDKDTRYGQFLKAHFTPDTLEAYWGPKLRKSNANSLDFLNTMQAYLTAGLDLDTFCRMVSKVDRNGADQVQEIVKRLLETEIFLADKDTVDPLSIDIDDERPYGAGAKLFLTMHGARPINHRLPIYIPLETFRDTLRKYFGQDRDGGDRFDIDAALEQYMANPPEISLSDYDYSDPCFHDYYDEDEDEYGPEYGTGAADELESDDSASDISYYDDLYYYKSGDTVAKKIWSHTGKLLQTMRSALCESNYKALCQQSARDQFAFLVRQNHGIILTEKRWDEIRQSLSDDPQAFARYYALARYAVNHKYLRRCHLALWTNDDLYRDILASIS